MPAQVLITDAERLESSDQQGGSARHRPRSLDLLAHGVQGIPVSIKHRRAAKLLDSLAEEVGLCTGLVSWPTSWYNPLTGASSPVP